MAMLQATCAGAIKWVLELYLVMGLAGSDGSVFAGYVLCLTQHCVLAASIVGSGYHILCFVRERERETPQKKVPKRHLTSEHQRARLYQICNRYLANCRVQLIMC